MGNEVDFSSKTTEDSIVRAVLYLRLSDEDRNKATNNDWSESIKNQEVMLRKYALENGWKIVGVYNDEDYSGSDRKRPNFNKMIKECALGNVDVVLVKTQARFSRDIELIDKYVHNKFKEWKVRFITLLEKIDNTKRETKKTSQIMGMIDEWYVEDTSINIRETFRIKREKGQFTGSFAPYGYKRDPENKNHLLIDPIPALIIERIYQEYAKGFGIGRIVAGLTRDSILSPLEYKMLNDCKLKIPIVKNEFDAAIVKKTGSYIVKSSFYNDTRQVLKDLITISVVMNGEKDSFDKFKIRVHKVSKQKVKLFYAIKDFKALKIEVDENNELILTHLNFDNDDWYSLSKGDMIPKNATCIALYVNKLDRTHEVNYELELELKENKEQREFFIKTFGLLNNLERPVRFVTQIRNKYNWSEQTR